MATAQVIGQSIKASKLSTDYQSEGSYLLAPVYEQSAFSGEMISGSLFKFPSGSVPNSILAQLALAYRQQKSVVVSIDAANKDIDYIDSTKTKLLLNKDGSFAIYNPDFEKLAMGEVADVSIRFLQPAASNGGSTLVINTTTLKVTGTNEAPTVEAHLQSVTDEDKDSYTLDLLQGARDIDHNAVLGAASVLESSGKALGWSLQGNSIVVNPSAYGYLNDGERETLNFTYKVMDEHGAYAAQTLTIDIEGITDPPTIVVETLAGSEANEVILRVTSTQAAQEQVKLAFLNLPEGTKVFDGNIDVTAGINDFFGGGYDGTHEFRLVFNGDEDLSTLVKVEVTGIHPAHGDYPYKELANAQSVALNYDVNETQDQVVTFSNSNLNMWGNWGSPVIEWHEYLPVLGNDFMQWENGEWFDTGVEYWNSGKITLADVSFNSSDVTDEALEVLATARDVALATLSEAQDAYEQAKKIAEVVTQYDYAKGIEKAFNTAKATLQSLENTLATEKSALRTAVGDAAFDVAHALDVWYVSDWGTLELGDETWSQATKLGDAARATALAAWDVFSSIYDAIASVPGFDTLKKAVYDAIDAVSDFTANTYNTAKTAVDDLAKTSAALFNDFTGLVNKIPDTLGLDLPDLPKAADWAAFINSLASKLDATVEGGFAFAAKAAQDAYDVAEAAVNAVDFSTQLKVDADISGYAGVLIDFRLDGGSVDTDVQYMFSSKTQYNQTTDMLAITPILVNVVDGEEVAFSTASPNVTITAKLLYDVAAALDVYLNGKMVVGELGFDLGDGLHFKPIFTTAGSNMKFEIIDTDEPIIDEDGFHLENLKVVMADHIIPYEDMFEGEAGDTIATPGVGTQGEITLFDFSSKTGELSVPFYSTNVADKISDKLSDLISSATEGMIEKIEVAIPYIATEGKYVSEQALLDEYVDSQEYFLNKLFDSGYDPTAQSIGQTINDYYLDETFKTVNIEQVTSIFENASVSLGKEVAALLDIDYLKSRGYTNLSTYLQGADIEAIIMDVSLNFAKNAFELFKETLDGKYTTDAFVIVDMTKGESDALFHVNTFNFNTDNILTDPSNPDSWPDPFLPYQDPDITDDTAAFGLYVASGESDPMYKVTLDVDEVVAFILRKVVQAATGITLPDSASPFKMGASLDDILSIAEVDKSTRETVKKYIDVGLVVDRMDYDVSSSIDFSQDFTLTVDDMTYLLTFTEGDSPVTKMFKASEADRIVIGEASQYDVNQDGKIEYDLQIVPTAMFSNDTELGYNYGLSLDFLKTQLTAKVGLPLKDLLGIPLLPNLSYDLLDYNIGPVLAIDAEINGLDIDVYESRFDMDIGEATLSGNDIRIDLAGIPAPETSTLAA